MHHRSQQLNKATPYTLGRLLGQGGAGAVYAAEDRRTGGKVAMKVMLSPHPRGILRFKQEFRVLSQRHHPNLVQMYELGCAEGHWYYTMELVEGQTLLDVLLPDQHDDDERTPTSSSTHISPLNTPQHRPFDTLDHGDAQDDTWSEGPACDLEALEGMLGQLLDALEFLHSQGIVHRDLKPSNILVDLNGNVRILDFGLALEHEATRGISLDGTVVGTPAYLSPEQCKGEPATTASDMYALGCILFKLLSGRLPFPGDANTTMLARITQPPPLIHRRVPNLPQQLAHVCNALLNPDPALRPTPAQVRALLHPGAQRATTPPPATHADAHTSKSTLWVGHDDELQALHSALDRAHGERFAYGTITGESGLGKSTLSKRAEAHARARGFTVLRGRCYQREQLPFAAFDPILDAVALEITRWPKHERATIEPCLARLVHLFPALEFALQGQHPIHLTPPATDPKARLAAATAHLADLFHNLQAHAPLLIVLDDLQWADHESVELLLALAARFDRDRICLLALARPEALHPDHVAARIFSQARDRALGPTLTLTPFAHAQMVRMVQHIEARAGDPHQHERLAQLGAGNPFLTQRLARLLAKLPPNARAAALDRATDSDTIVQLLFEHTHADAQRLLDIAATAGGPIDAALLEALSPLTPSAHAHALQHLIDAQLLTTLSRTRHASTSHTARYDLHHDRIRDAAYNRLAPEARADLHRAFALAIEARTVHHDDTPIDRDLEALVRHWHAAGDAARTHRFALQAAQRAEDKLAFGRAAQLLRLALTPPHPLTPHRVALTWERIGQLEADAGFYARARDAFRAALDRWRALPEDTPDRAVALLRVRTRLGSALLYTNAYAAARDAFADALKQVGLGFKPHRAPPALLLLLVFLRLRVALHTLTRSNTTTADPLARETLTLFNTLRSRALFVWPMASVEAGARAQLLERRIDDPNTRFQTLLSPTIAQVILKRPSPRLSARIDQRLDRAEALTRQHTIPNADAHLQTHRALRWFLVDLKRSKLLYETALAAYRSVGMTHSPEYTRALGFYIMALMANGDNATALHVQRQHAHLTREPNANVLINLHLNLNTIHSASGDVERALYHHQQIASILQDTPTVRFHHLGASARQNTLNALGHFHDVLRFSADFRRAHPHMPKPLSFPGTMWSQQELQACLGLLRRGALTPTLRKHAHTLARRLQRYPAHGFPAQGLAAQARLEHAAGDPKRAALTLRAALQASEHDCTPYNRWLVLTTALDLDALTADLHTELDAIVARCGYAPLPTTPSPLTC